MRPSARSPEDLASILASIPLSQSPGFGDKNELIERRNETTQ